MKLTIITPSYNQAAFLPATLDSVLGQDIDNLEYWVIDGGSSDDSAEILRSYSERYPGRLQWVSEPDRGQTDAVNKGLRRATGDIIGWLNSDDIYYPQACRQVLDYFAAQPEAMVVYGRADHIDRDGDWLEEYPTEAWNYPRLLETCYLCQPAVFFRRQAVEQHGLLDDSLQYCMDYEYWLRLGKATAFHQLPVKLAGSRLYAETKTLGAKTAVHREILRMLYEKTGQISSIWLSNYGHAVAADAGLTRETPEQEWQFVKTVSRAWLSESWRLYGRISRRELRNVAGWLWAAWRQGRRR